MLVVAYAIYFVLFVKVSSEGQSQDQDDLEVPRLIRSLLPPFALIFIVLGSIISGVASPTEAAGIGALGAMLIAWSGGNSPVVCLRKQLVKPLLLPPWFFSFLSERQFFLSCLEVWAAKRSSMKFSMPYLEDFLARCSWSW